MKGDKWLAVETAILQLGQAYISSSLGQQDCPASLSIAKTVNGDEMTFKLNLTRKDLIINAQIESIHTF